MSELNGTKPPISPDFLAILRCPLAVQEKEKYGEDAGKLALVHNSWLVSADSGYKYPIRDGIPIMLIEEGARWKDTPVDSLPVPPPPAPAIAGSSSDPADAAACGVQPGGGFSLSPECRQRLPFMLAGLVLLLAFLFLRRNR
jgi:uncharacterized protein YbaR (Trm112 family)